MSSGLRSIRPAFTALLVLVLFLAAFVAFILAPLLMVVVVAAFMWGYEHWRTQRRQPGVRALSTPRSLAREAGSRREDLPEQTYGFGSSMGRDL